LKLNVLVGDDFHVEANGRNGFHHFTALQFVQNGALSSPYDVTGMGRRRRRRKRRRKKKNSELEEENTERSN
jgi:hypothetical protein